MIFHKHKLVVTGIPKNASSSIYDVLKNQTDKEHNHLKFIDEFGHQDPDLVETYLSVAVVRNPYDRFISACWQIRRDHESSANLDINEIILQEHPSQFDNCNEVFSPQYRYITLGSKILVDYVLRYETLQQDWEEFLDKNSKHFVFPINPTLPFSNKSLERKSWQEELKNITKDNFKLINEIYSRDFKLFNYKPLTYDNL